MQKNRRKKKKNNMKKRNIKIIIFVVIILAVLIGNHYFGWSAYFSDADHLSFLTEMVETHKILAFCIYIGVTIIGCVVVALPGVSFAILAGMLFGPWLGILACLIATTIGAMAAFLVGRFFLKDAVKPMLEKNRTLKKLLFSENARNDFIVLMITRMVPIFPYNLQNFAYGVTDISFARYSVLTFVFMLPGVSLYTIGAAGLTAESGKWMYFVGAGVLAILVTVVGMMIRKKYLGDEENE